MRLQWKQEWTAPSAIGAVSYIFGAGTMIVVGVITNWKMKKTDNKNNDFNKLKEEIEEFQSLMVQNDFKIREQQEQFNHSIRQMAKIITELNDDKPRSFISGHKITTFADLYVPNVTDTSVQPELFEEFSDWNEEVELKARNPTEPYVIHRNEYFNDDEGFQSHATLTYYKGDDVLCDEHDTPIYNVSKIVGDLKFGHGSNDPSIVYIRNENLKAEYEVLLDPGYFQVEVLGEEIGDNLNDDLKHSHLRKFRSD